MDTTIKTLLIAIAAVAVLSGPSIADLNTFKQDVKEALYVKTID